MHDQEAGHAAEHARRPRLRWAVRALVWTACAGVLMAGWMADEPMRPAPVPLAAQAGMPGGPPLKIMPLGASSTVGARSPETGGYRGYLENLLNDDGVPFDFVGSQQQGPAWMPDRDHEGHGGTIIPEILPSTPGWIAATHPDVVLLHVGTNDLIRGASGAEVAARLQKLLTAIWNAEDGRPDPYVVVAGVWAPMATKQAAKADFTMRAAALVSALRAQGRPVTFVDTSSLLATDDVADGLHPNSAGYELVARMFDREIGRYLAARH
ncbi:GDSL-type esterase/lipase family protein [Pseudonocardia sp. CA-107938]|uniref:GDSL-type esterase/lipase family protein n=1 Tax=Pseudonocardia sp. CA-107938 TaxID=3240021 RepID=UPI003D926A07